MENIIINHYGLTLEQVYEVAHNKSVQVALSHEMREKIEKSRAFINRCINQKKVVYGVTTGFGQFKNKTVDPSQTRELQSNLIISHSIGTGNPLPENIVRAMILIRANSLSQGHSGVRVELIEKLLEILNKGVYPFIPSQGSVGASGDLAPLSHLASVVIGYGEVFKNNQRIPTQQALKELNIMPLVLEAKEGLAMNNGTALMAALGTINIIESEQLSELSDITLGMSLEAMMGSVVAYDERIHKLRPHAGQQECAAHIRKLCAGSEIILSHQHCDRVQDSYSLRCAPQVHGAVRDAIKHVRGIMEIEINSVTDNPLIFPDDEQVMSGGNFHGAPLSIALDYLAMALTDLSSISERRIFKILDSNLNEGLPAFLIAKDKAGLNSGYMIAQYTAASLVAENKVLAGPASIDSISTCANQEDHVSFGPIAGRKAAQVLENTRKVLAIELMCAAQGIDFRKPLKPGKCITVAQQLVRARVPMLEQDRELYLDLEKIIGLVQEKDFYQKIHDSISYSHMNNQIFL